VNINVRQGSIGDVEALGLLRYRMDLEQNGQSMALAEFQTVFRDWFDRHEQEWLPFLAEDAARPVGVLCLGLVPRLPRPSDPAPAVIGYVTFFYVEPSHRNHRVGARLLQAVNDFADAAPFDTLVVWPGERSASAYLRAGFRAPTELLERTILD
jgi:GNAT superfamily N-acetyltransferase